VDGSRIRKEKVADSKISGYVWTGPKKSQAKDSAECVFLYAGLVTYFALQVNVIEDNRILRDGGFRIQLGPKFMTTFIKCKCYTNVFHV